MEALVGKGHYQEIESLNRGRMGTSKIQTVKGKDRCGKKEVRLLLRNFGVQVVSDSLKFPSVVMVLDLRNVKYLLVPLKSEVEWCLVRIEVGQESSRPKNDEAKGSTT